MTLFALFCESVKHTSLHFVFTFLEIELYSSCFDEFMLISNTNEPRFFLKLSNWFFDLFAF